MNSYPNSADIAREILPNGIIVLARENFTSKAVVITGTLNVGGLEETDADQGIASLVAASLMRGTAARDFDTIHETLESIGATLSFGAGTHSTSFGGKALAEDLPVLLGLLREALREPTFPVDQVERLRAEILTGLRIRQQDSRAVAGEAFRKLIYPPDHPYSRGSTEELVCIPNITLDAMRQFQRENYAPGGMIIVVVGAVRCEDAIRIVREALGDWANNAAPRFAIPPAPPLPAIRREVHPLPGKTQTDILLGWAGPARMTGDFQAANLANAILGVFGMMGRLGKSVREQQGLAYYCGSRLSGGHGPGPWQVSAGVNPANVDRAITSIVQEIERLLTEPIPTSELDDVKSNFIGRLPLSLESNEGVAGAILNMETYGLGLDYLQGYAAMIRAITMDEIQAAARHYIHPAAYALSIAGAQ
jgi:zinc protease